ncbi:MAG: cytochrome P450 [Caldilineaceae bacterium]|nr:cytochrome P450 [Caldilineaceae bacterium]
MILRNQVSSIELDLNDPAFIRNPYPRLAQLREETPIFWEPRWRKLFFTRYADIAFLLRDRRLGRSITPILSREELGWPPPDPRLPAYNNFQGQILMEHEAPDHTRLRGLVAKAFTPHRVEGLRPKITAIVSRLLDNVVERGEMDLLADFAEPLPVTVIAELLGVPEEKRHKLRPWSAAIVKLYEVNYSEEQAATAEQAVTDFSALLRDLVAERRQQPQDDLITALVQAEEAGDRLIEEELIANCIFLLNAGHEASVNGLTGGMLALFRHPSQLRLLQDAAAQGKQSIFKPAVEELLRYESPLPLFERWVLQDFSYQGVELRQGTEVALLYASGNRDEERFANADQLDVTRQDNPHLTFGLGTHYCLGAPLARLELQIALATLLQRLPNIRLAVADEEIVYQSGFVIRGVQGLPVVWGSG